MLGTSFFGKHDMVANTVGLFCEALREHGPIVLGLETEESRDDPKVASLLSAIRGGSPKGSEGYLWDQKCNRAVLKQWPDELPMPFYHNYSYGGAVNRLLALARIANCDYLVRVDPGTAPLSGFPEVVDRHVGMISAGKARVVSGQYTGRPAVRAHFVLADRADEYYRFIYDYTGVDPSPEKQVTGGAAFAVAVSGPPAIPFDGAMVWASDDGFFQASLGQGLAKVLVESRIYRTDFGVTLNLKQYFCRLAHMVVLHERQRNNADERAARRIAQKFLDNLVDFVDPALRQAGEFKEVEFIDARKELNTSVVFEGCDNYRELLSNWLQVIEALGDAGRTLGLQCRIW